MKSKLQNKRELSDEKKELKRIALSHLIIEIERTVSKTPEIEEDEAEDLL